MPEETKDVSAEGAQESKVPPVPNISSGSEQESSAGTGIDVGAIAESVAGLVLKQLDGVLDNKVDARFKSAKDVRFAKVEEIAQWVKAAGGDPAKIQGDLTVAELRERLAALEQGGDRGGSAAPAAQGKSLSDKTAEFLSKSEADLGVTLNRDELEQLSKSRTYTSEDQWYQEITKSLVKKAKSGVVTGAAVVGTGGSAPVPSGDIDKLVGELNTILDSGRAHTLENRKRIAELRARIDELEPPQRTGAVVGL